MKSIQEVVEALAQGLRPVIEFKSKILDMEGYAEPNMRARLVACVEKPQYDSYVLSLDFSEFDAFNLVFETTSWFDKAGNPTLTAREAGQYAVLDSVYVDTSDDLESLFDLVPDANLLLFKAFKRFDTPLSYITWLENELNSACSTLGYVLKAG